MPVIQTLHDNLTKQVEVYRELKELEDHKKEVLMTNNIQELEAVTVREEQLLIEASHLEKKRLLWAEQISQMMGKPAEELTLSELAAKYPQLEEVKEELETVIKVLFDVHDLNTQLLNQAMSVVNFTVDMLTHQEKNTYQKPGMKDNQGPNPLRILDRKI